MLRATGVVDIGGNGRGEPLGDARGSETAPAVALSLRERHSPTLADRPHTVPAEVVGAFIALGKLVDASRPHSIAADKLSAASSATARG
jgi:hypothetical protein